jgi:hypothetical protein
MPMNQDIQGTTPRSSTHSEVAPRSSPAMDATEQKPAAPNNSVTPGRVEPKQDARSPQAKRIPDAKRPEGAGRLQPSVNPVGGNQPVATKEQEKDTRPVAAL